MKHTKDGPYINSYLISTPTGLQISLYRKLYQSAIYWYRGRVWVLYITQYEYIRIRHYVTRCHLPHIFLEVIRHCSRRFDNNHPYLIPQKKDMWQGYRFANICWCICLSTLVYPKIMVPKYLVFWICSLIRSHLSSINIIPAPLIIAYQRTKASFYIVLNISQRMLLLYCTHLPSVVVFPMTLLRRGPVN